MSSAHTRAEAKRRAARIADRLVALMDDPNAPRPEDIPASLDGALSAVVKLSAGLVAPEKGGEGSTAETGEAEQGTPEFFAAIRQEGEARNAKANPAGPSLYERFGLTRG